MMDTTPTSTGLTVSSSSPDEQQALVEPGQVLLGRYRVERHLGSGGYGDVVAALDQRAGRQVAIKVLNPRALQNDPSALARMRQEAELLQAIDHPNIVTVHDFHSQDDTHLLVMELLDGTPLDFLIERQGPASSERMLPLVRQLLEALHAAHQAGVLHRDIKPENIILLEAADAQDLPQVKLVDFGLAKAVGGMGTPGEDDPTLVKTRAGGFLGTPRYCSPEQAVGDPIGPQTDLFSLGLVIAEWLTGVVRLQGETYGDLMSLLVSKQPLDLQDVPYVWRGWLRRMLAKSVEERYLNVVQALEGLQELVEFPLRGGHTTGETTRELEFDTSAGRFVPSLSGQGTGGDLPEESADFLALDAPLELDLDRVQPVGPATPAHGLQAPLKTPPPMPRFQGGAFHTPPPSQGAAAPTAGDQELPAASQEFVAPPAPPYPSSSAEPPRPGTSGDDDRELQITPGLILAVMLGSGLLVFALLLLVGALFD